MISVCCCGINARWDVDCFIKCLAKHNEETNFEVCFTHDNRVNDGGSKHYLELSRKYPWFKVIEHTKQDTVEWLEWMLDLYRREDRFAADFRVVLEANLQKFKRDEFCDVKKSFLWVSSGILYNKAVSISQGDYLVVTPADFLYLFSLSDLENHLRQHARQGRIYAKPNAIWTRISNSPEWWLREKMREDREKLSHPPNSRMADAQRDYLRYPSGPEDLNLVDFRHDQLLNLNNADFTQKMKVYTQECWQHPDDQQIGPAFHGVHAMSRLAYKEIGGFTEGYYGRAFADDNMSQRGMKYSSMLRVPYQLPPQFSIGWIGQGEYLPGRFTYLSPGDYANLLKEKDDHYGEHPIPGACGWGYLHDGYPDRSYLNNLTSVLNPYLMRAPDRFTRGID